MMNLWLLIALETDYMDHLRGAALSRSDYLGLMMPTGGGQDDIEAFVRYVNRAWRLS